MKSIMKVFRPLIPKTLLTPLIGLNLLNFGSIAFGVNRNPVCKPSAIKAATNVRASIGRTTNPITMKDS